MAALRPCWLPFGYRLSCNGGLAETSAWEDGRYGDRLPVQKGHRANLEYVEVFGGQLGGHRRKLEVPA